jgi:3-hexulose-6-phosphate synthase
MKLQLALDAIGRREARELVEKVHGSIDILEFGTPFLLGNSLFVVGEAKDAFPGLEILADIKIMDGGDYMASLAFDAGADYVTVLGVARDETIAGAVRAAERTGKRVLADLLATADPAGRAVELEALGVYGVCVHTGFEPGAGRDQLQMLESVSGAITRAAVSVAGGISPSTVPAILAFNPEIVVVGGSITSSSDPVGAVAEIRALAENERAVP